MYSKNIHTRINSGSVIIFMISHHILCWYNCVASDYWFLHIRVNDNCSVFYFLKDYQQRGKQRWISSLTVSISCTFYPTAIMILHTILQSDFIKYTGILGAVILWHQLYINCASLIIYSSSSVHRWTIKEQFSRLG